MIVVLTSFRSQLLLLSLLYCARPLVDYHSMTHDWEEEYVELNHEVDAGTWPTCFDFARHPGPGEISLFQLGSHATIVTTFVPHGECVVDRVSDSVRIVYEHEVDKDVEERLQVVQMTVRDGVWHGPNAVECNDRLIQTCTLVSIDQ